MPNAEQILDAAERIHRKYGLKSLSVRRVAEAVGVTPMALYKHFADKDDLLDALVLRGFAILETYFAAAAAQPTALQRVRTGLTQYREFALAQRRYFELMFFVRRRAIPTAPASLRESSSPSFVKLIEAVAECMARGELRQGDPAETILLAWATAHGLIALHFSGRFADDDARFRAIYDRAMDEQQRLLAG
jgi:AcrR family transcriptional regulator